MKNVNRDILQSIITEHSLSATQNEELLKVIEKLTPYKLVYKGGFANCKCDCEFESEGYADEEICPSCGQIVWVGGYTGKPDKVLEFKSNGIKTIH